MLNPILGTLSVFLFASIFFLPIVASLILTLIFGGPKLNNYQDATVLLQISQQDATVLPQISQQNATALIDCD
jgi:hypothetical protein